MQSDKYAKESYIAVNELDWWEKHPNLDVLRKYKYNVKGIVGDLGSNNGICTVHFPKVCDFDHVIGIDINPDCAIKGKALVQSLNLNHKISFCLFSYLAYPHYDNAIK